LIILPTASINNKQYHLICEVELIYIFQQQRGHHRRKIVAGQNICCGWLKRKVYSSRGWSISKVHFEWDGVYSDRYLDRA